MKTRPGIERIMVESLRASMALARKHIKAHMKVCDKCSKSGNDLRARCDAWWDLARVIHNAERTLSKYDTPGIGVQLMLPGMEEL